MSDFTAAISRPERPNVRTDCSWYPRAFFTGAETWHGAVILTERGKDEFRKFVERSVRLPGEETARKELAEAIAGDVEFWTHMNEDFGDTGEDLSGQEAVIDGWARSGEIPPLHEAIAELSVPGLTAECEDFAMSEFPGWAERSAEREELASYRVERWLSSTNPGKDKDWLPRAELWTAYEVWCRFDGGSGHGAGKPNDFYTALQDLGFVPAGRQGKRGFKPAKR